MLNTLLLLTVSAAVAQAAPVSGGDNANTPLRLAIQLTLAALPCILVWCYVQQPDRALWNFAFVAMPVAAVVLARCAPGLGWALVAAHAMVTLRFGAQFNFVPPAKYSLIVAMVLAVIAVWQLATSPQRRLSPA